MSDSAADPRPKPSRAIRAEPAPIKTDLPAGGIERLHARAAREGRAVRTLVQELLIRALDETPGNG